MSIRACAVGPAGSPPWVYEAVRSADVQEVSGSNADVLVWTAYDSPEELGVLLRDNPSIRCIHLIYSGIDPYLDLIDSDRTWSCGKGALADPVAEHALALLLALRHQLHRYARKDSEAPEPLGLAHARIAVIGAGAVGRRLLELLQPFSCDVRLLRRRAGEVPGASSTVQVTDLNGTLRWCDVAVLALPLTEETYHLMNEERLSQMRPSASLVNVARGLLVDTLALLRALDHGALSGAALDVTDPEPLPSNHPLWTHPRCIVTPHIAATDTDARQYLGARLITNLNRMRAGEEPLGMIDPQAKY